VLASVGLRTSRPLVTTLVVALPPVFDTGTGTAVGAGVPRLRRSTVICQSRRRLLDELGRQAQAAIGLGAVTFTRRRFPYRDLVSGRPLVELTATALPLFAAAAQPHGSAFFRTTLAATDIAALIRAGWMPADIVLAGDLQVRRPIDAPADAQVVTGRRNAEIAGATRSVTAARSAVRAALRKQAATIGADGLLVGPFETYWSATRHRVEVVAVGDAIVRWRHTGAAVALRSTVRLGAVGE
jgi:hypothetical protein